MDWINLAQDGWKAFTNTEMKLRFPIKDENSLTCHIVRMTLLCGVNFVSYMKYKTFYTKCYDML